MKEVIIVGGGPAGMAAALSAAENGDHVRLFEKNEKLGKKLFITGKGRCNLTNQCDIEELFPAMVSNEKFMYSSFYGYSNQDVMDFFEKHGCPLKTERGKRVFPVSDHSSDIIRTLEKALHDAGVAVFLNKKIAKCLVMDGICIGVEDEEGKKIYADKIILAMGGCSYPLTGSDGEGLTWAEELGHKITEPLPALVSLNTKEEWVVELQGLSLKNISITILDEKDKKIYQEFGEMLFTHFGVSGPVVLTASSFIGKKLKKTPLSMKIDLKPALSREQLDARVLRDWDEMKNKQFRNSLSALLPSKLIPVIISLSEIPPEKKINEISREERSRLVNLLKALPITLVSTRGFEEAIITQGGVSVKDINPSTMESKKISHLYMAGEMLDLDAVTGGFNLQIAWSTGHLAGS